MKLLFDMNLSPLLVARMNRAGWESYHWSTIGDPRATDSSIMDWAKRNGHLIVTNDLDFGDILAATNAQGPSVIQVRTQDISPTHLESILLALLEQCKHHLESGSLISVDEKQSRIRILPMR